MSELRLGKPNRRSAHYPRFSSDEYDRRYTAVRTLMDEHGLDALLIYGDGRFHAGMYYLTNYEPYFPTYFVFFADPNENSTLFVGISNHVQYIREVSEVDELRLMLPNPPSGVVDRLKEADVANGRIGLVTGDPRYNISIPHTHYEMLRAKLDAEVVEFTAEYIQAISVASPEEHERVERAAGALDAAMRELEGAAEPGVTERELSTSMRNAAETAGGTYSLDFISTAPMENAEPGEPIPWKHPSTRPLRHGDVITTEISARYQGYQSQIHRPYAVGDPPTEVYRDLYDVAEETYENMVGALQPGNTVQAVYEATAPVEESDYKIYDVMCHGYGGAYRHPFVGVEESNYWPGAEDQLTAEWEFKPGMIAVVQPNVLTEDETAALQLGTTVIIRESGPEVVQEYPVDFIQT